MERTKHILLLTLVLCLIGQPAHADRLFKQKEDLLYKYYVGRAIVDDDEISAFEKATKDAYRQAIKENFGVYTNYQSDFYGGLKEKSLVIRNREHSQRVFIKDFEQVENRTTTKNNRNYLYVLFRYSKAAIKSEKKRLSGRSLSSSPLLSQVGESKTTDNTRLQIVTHPPRAEIYLNNQRWGVTPVDLRGIPDGRYKVHIDHPHYESIDEELVINTNRAQRLEKTLIPAKTQFQIDSEPAGAQISINGKMYGTTPSTITVTANDQHHLTLRHQDTETLSRTFSGAKGQLQSIVIELPYKQTYFSINSEPVGAKLFIDGVDSGYVTQAPPSKLSIAAGEHVLELRKEGYATKEINENFEVDQVNHLGLQNLEIEQPRSEEYDSSDYLEYVEPYSYPIKYTLNMDINSPTNEHFNDPWFYSLGLSVEYRFSNYLGVLIGGSWDLGFLMEDQTNFEEPQYVLSGYGIKLSIPIYFASTDKTWFLSLDGGYINHTYKDENNGSSPSFELKQQRYGVSIGKTMINDRFEWRMSYLNYIEKDQPNFDSFSFGFGINFY